MFHPSSLLKNHGIQALFTYQESESDFSLGDEIYPAHNVQTLCDQSGFVIPHQVIQVHAAEVAQCSGSGYLHQQEADILLATEQGAALAIRTADCLPILLADKQAGVIAAAHAGWKGTVAQVAVKAVQAMCTHGARIEHIVASLGPCIGLCCFEVKPDVAQKLTDSCQEKVSCYRGDRCFVDLPQVNQYQLRRAGVLAENIEVSTRCTACHVNPPYYSYRRDKGETGRQLSMIMLP